MKNTNLKVSLTALTMLAAAVFLVPHAAQAHCDGMDGPVVKAALVAAWSHFIALRQIALECELIAE